jgi:hypothetical protein
MTHGHTFWFLLLGACVVWYSTITIYVAIKGSLDIRKMLEDLRLRDATAKPLATNNQQPTTKNQQPRTNNQQPTTIKNHEHPNHT